MGDILHRVSSGRALVNSARSMALASFSSQLTFTLNKMSKNDRENVTVMSLSFGTHPAERKRALERHFESFDK